MPPAAAAADKGRNAFRGSFLSRRMARLESKQCFIQQHKHYLTHHHAWQNAGEDKNMLSYEYIFVFFLPEVAHGEFQGFYSLNSPLMTMVKWRWMVEKTFNSDTEHLLVWMRITDRLSQNTEMRLRWETEQQNILWWKELLCLESSHDYNEFRRWMAGGSLKGK